MPAAPKQRKGCLRVESGLEFGRFSLFAEFQVFLGFLGEGPVYLNGPAQVRNEEVIIGGASAYDCKDIVGEGVVFILLDSFF